MPVSEPTVRAILTLPHIQAGPDERAHEWVRIVLNQLSMLVLVHLRERLRREKGWELCYSPVEHMRGVGVCGS